MSNSLIPSTPILAGVVGSPINHSLSPLIHTIWAHRAGVNGYYIPLEIPSRYDDFARAMASLQTIGFAGVNVTLPHKEHALRYATRASDAATRAGAANMLSFNTDGVYADNSDISGFSSAVEGVLSGALAGKENPTSALVLGAGGAARGIVLALQGLGISDICITNRTREKADILGAEFMLKVVDWDNRDDAIGDKGIIVNTTSLGMSGQPPLDIDLARLVQNAVVADIVYAPLETPLLKTAREMGRVTIDGLDMLMHQAVPGFRAWFVPELPDQMPVVDQPLRIDLIAELDRRARERK